MPGARVVAVDLPWSAGHPDRTAVAVLTPAAQVSVVPVDPSEPIPSVIARLAAPDADVLLDIPIAGCTGEPGFRPVDRRLARAGIPILPWTAAGTRGAELARAISERLPDARVHEVYPYAVLRVLWALKATGRLGALRPGEVDGSVEPGWAAWPPRYKRGRTRAERLRALAEVWAALTDRSLGLEFDPPLPAPDPRASLARLADRYDAVLALVPGLLGFAHPAVHCERDEGGGAILLLADAWLRKRLGRRGTIDLR